jgi:peptidoglycan/xylan/chitin deacetylase (PgdA/CDA1 family)
MQNRADGRLGGWLVVCLTAGLLTACAAPAPAPVMPPPAVRAPPAPATPPAGGRVLGRSDRFVIYQPAAGDTLRSISGRFLGSESREWIVADFNAIAQAEVDRPLVIPLKPINPLGVYADQYQTVPILCYHRFGTGNGNGNGSGGKMTVSTANFAAQLDWLARNDYHVIKLAQVVEFLEGRQALPKRSVVITIDDGYESVLRLALPLLRKHGFAATLFVYTDFIGAPDALSWSQLQELLASGLVDVQAHSKTHRNLIERQAGDSDERYAQMLDTEVRAPREALERRLPAQVRHYAFPYGDANQALMDVLARQRYHLALTVNPGGNAFFAQPLMLRRTMVYGDHDLEAFKLKLQTARGINAP